MSTLFLDSSALAKRYLPEQGTAWLRDQLANATTIIVSRLTSIEIMSAVARRYREGRIDANLVNDIHLLIEKHVQEHYLVLDINDLLAQDAIQLLIRHPLRAYDAVQLATASLVNKRLITHDLDPVTFLCADTRLLEIALIEGLAVDNPENHP